MSRRHLIAINDGYVTSRPTARTGNHQGLVLGWSLGDIGNDGFDAADPDTNRAARRKKERDMGIHWRETRLTFKRTTRSDYEEPGSWARVIEACVCLADADSDDDTAWHRAQCRLRDAIRAWHARNPKDD